MSPHKWEAKLCVLCLFWWHLQLFYFGPEFSHFFTWPGHWDRARFYVFFVAFSLIAQVLGHSFPTLLGFLQILFLEMSFFWQCHKFAQFSQNIKPQENGFLQMLQIKSEITLTSKKSCF